MLRCAVGHFVVGQRLMSLVGDCYRTVGRETSILRTRLVPAKIIRRQKSAETAEENKVEQANCPLLIKLINGRSLHICHKKYSVWALALNAIRL